MNAYSAIPIIICIIVVLLLVSFISCSWPEPKRPVNNVRYYVTKDYFDKTCLWLGKPEWNEKDCVWYGHLRKHVNFVCYGFRFKDYNLNIEDYRDMKNGDIREVSINLED